MRTRAILCLVIVTIVIVTSCSEVGYKEVPRYTIEQFMNRTAIMGGSLSYDESRILIGTDRTGVFNLYTVPVGGGEMTQLTFSDTSSIFPIGFFPKDDRILFGSDQNGNEIYHIYLMDVEGEITDLTPDEGARSTFAGWMFDDESFLFTSNKRDRRIMDIYEMDIVGFEARMIYQNDEGYSPGGTSNDERYIALVKFITENNTDIYLLDRQSKEVTHLTPHEGDIAHYPVTFSVDSKHLYYLTNENSEFAYLMRYDIASGKKEKIAEAEWDIMYAYFSRSGKYRVVGINNDARTEIQVLNTQTGKPVELPELPDADITSVGISRSEKLMIFYVNGSRSPSNLYVLSIETGQYQKLTESISPEIDPENLVDARVVRYPSFDGLEIPALLYKPHQIKRGQKAPAVVRVHGGPGGQARFGYNSTVQYLVNHGYVVIDVNNRGSSGYGKTFLKADDLRHGADDLDDCVYAKYFLETLGYVDTSKVAILGGSYGGYIVLAALTFRPLAFAAGVDLYGISNWVRTLESIPPWWEYYKDAIYAELGDPEKQRDYLMSISPLFHADSIKRPLIVLQGANDPRVPQAESDEIVEAVKRNKVPVEYIVFEDEGHGFLKKENVIESRKAIRAFLDKHLRGTDPY
ncbi:MAG: S9 family peptidase [Candidatus Zixiibacteriota bacterium]|nr:MAG: S9 family peptidase [candidate division Zixibacteria bacterium]